MPTAIQSTSVPEGPYAQQPDALRAPLIPKLVKLPAVFACGKVQSLADIVMK